MTYRATDESSTLSHDERITEAKRLLGMGMADQVERMTSREAEFVQEMIDGRANDGISVKQLWWLRDLHSKYVVGG